MQDFFFFFQLWHVGSSSWPGIETRPPALGAQSFSHRTTREVPPGKSHHYLSAFSVHSLLCLLNSYLDVRSFLMVPQVPKAGSSALVSFCCSDWVIYIAVSSSFVPSILLLSSSTFYCSISQLWNFHFVLVSPLSLLRLFIYFKFQACLKFLVEAFPS